MRVITNPQYAAHVPRHEVDNGEPVAAWEVPARFEAIRAALAAHSRFRFEEPPPVSEAAVLGLHTPDYLAYLREAGAELSGKVTAIYPSVFPHGPNPQALGPKSRRGIYCFDTFTPITTGTLEAALGGAAAALHAADLVASGEHAVYVLTRPPGHHAERARCGGYSFLNNAALAADRLAKLGRVAVLDLDVHHGNGTQQLFYDRPDVLVVSLHGDPTSLFPYFTGTEAETGIGPGLGFNVNLPLPPGTGVRKYRPAFGAALERIGGFKPAFLVVSFGADTHENDPIGGFRLPTEEFTKMGEAVRQLALPTVVVQEGGYNTVVLGDCVLSFLDGLGSQSPD